ncbi:PepSY domain-containing protein [uncultured Tenacibaculum sp.]|uniref:PepSY domain-containing protein n=1 Tax=uncultured Tenacibaculum sp. TaxID=174713 RepID=UPI00263672BC|nr:PepSY domain-containing protein [uncultured Tenacibaculum sp.]
MTTSIWRYSHLTLAISSFAFILIASLTGIILAFEPISNQLKPFAVQNANEITLSKTISSLKNEYDEIVELKIDENNFVIASVVTKNGKSSTFYINPFTGKKIGNIIKRAPIYKWTTNLHRSLFLKSTGRFLVGLFSLLLFLITITGSILIIKRQGGIINFFTKVIHENFEQYYHVIISRYALIPIIIITLTGVYLSLEKFSLFPKTTISHKVDFPKTENYQKIAIEKFPFFKTTKLNDLKSLEFPFSDDGEDYFLVKLKNKDLIIHQYSGEIISSKKLPWIHVLSNWSLFLHTGRGTIIWSIILLLSCIAILFFIYSGFSITLKKRALSSLPKNKFNKNNAEYIILIGSETGNTYSFANSIYNALLTTKRTVFIDHLNNYTFYKSAKQLIILTSTYGEGTAPINATSFLKLVKKVKQKKSINYAIIGFGSLAYPNYCQFAIDIENTLKTLPNFISVIPLYKINNQNFAEFKTWGLQWSNKIKIDLDLKQEVKKRKKQKSFTIIDKTELNEDNSFLIRLKSSKKLNFTSGDLLSITPNKDNVKRLYSIGKIDNDILLSIKKHDFGICSNLLLNLNITESIQASIKQNKAFHFPKNNKEVILIANGTGIAPFLGMLNNSSKTHMFWGGRTLESFSIYKPYLQNTNLHIAYSQEGKKQYVQDLISKETELITNVLKNNGTIMICGSIAMMNAVLKVLEKITLTELNTPIKKYQKNLQLKTDCY